MIVNSKYHNSGWYIIIGLLAINLLNHALWNIGGYIHPYIYLVIGFVYFAFICTKPVAGVVVFLFSLWIVFTSISYPLVDWDARSIWFYHARLIFYDNDLFSQFYGNVKICCQNDYPVLISAIAASIAKGVGFWNEVFPKISLAISLMPIILFIRLMFSSKIQVLLFISIIYLSTRYLLNGYMDAILGLYCAVSVTIIYYLYQKCSNVTENKLFATLLLLTTSVLLIKNEGQAFSLLALLSIAPLYRKNIIKLLLLLTPIITYIVLWKYALITHNIPGDLFTPGVFERSITRLSDFKSMQLIISSCFNNAWHSFVFLWLIIIFNKVLWKKWLASLFLIISYSLIIVFIYIITPSDLAWHLSASVDRTFMVVNICSLLLFFSVFKEKFKYLNSNE